MTWRVEWLPAAQKQLRRLDVKIQRDLLKFCRERLASDDNPRRFGKLLIGDFTGLWRYRVGDYRLLCEFEDDCLVVLVVEAGHRREVYQGH
ncbi:MAG: type II toxin-antitoxin system RelE/ParE family toxin [Rhodospirillaceae bacterium]